MKKTTQLKNMLYSGELEFIMEAHNGLSAKIVQEAGFKGIWASGLSISASLGIRDNNEASWTQVLEVVEFMSDATTLPILLDGDTGYGNFNNVRRLTKKLEQREIAGVCIEDKLFPKTNSFIRGENQPLADIDEFCSKIKAAKDVQKCEDFVVAARVEAFIAGWGLKEALRRAEAYRQAGADAILIHSKKSDPSEIDAFMKEWAKRHPVIIVPTKYYSASTDFFRHLEVSMIIWANHNLRAAVTAMKSVTSQIYKDQTLINVEHKVAPVSEIFRLQGAEELQHAENKYLPTVGKQVNAIVLAASQGSLGELTRDIPKTLLRVSGKSILTMLVEELNSVGIKDVTVVRGFAKHKIKRVNIKTVDNDEYATTKDLYSLYLARDMLRENTVVTFGDIVFKNYILNDLLNDSNDITMIVDADYQLEGQNKDFVITSEPYSKKLYSQTVEFKKMSSTLDKDEINGEFIGVWKVSGKGAQVVKQVMERMYTREDFKQLTVTDLFNQVIEICPIAVKYIKDSWLDVDTIVDLQRAGDFT